MAKSSNKPTITRITAKDSGPKRVKPAKTSEKPAAKAQKTKTSTEQPKKRGILGRIKDYFKDSWHELTLVRWPDRKTTWKMTGALIIFTITFAVVILLLDYVFQYVFKLLIGK